MLPFKNSQKCITRPRTPPPTTLQYTLVARAESCYTCFCCQWWRRKATATFPVKSRWNFIGEYQQKCASMFVSGQCMWLLKAHLSSETGPSLCWPLNTCWLLEHYRGKTEIIPDINILLHDAEIRSSFHHYVVSFRAGVGNHLAWRATLAFKSWWTGWLGDVVN